jgi:hypothetical protein
MPLLPIVVELFIDAAWTDITDRVYARDPITITRGRANEANQAGPSRLSLQVNNRDGRYSPRNPTGIYYGKIGRNTPIRLRLTGETDARFVGEVIEWPQQWNASETDVWVPIEAAGIMRRLGQGGSTPKSAPRRFIPTTNPTAYWPLEDGPEAVEGAAAIGGLPFRQTGGAVTGGPAVPVKFGVGDLGEWLLPGARGVSAASNSRMAAAVRMARTADDWAVDLTFRVRDALCGTILEVFDNGPGASGDPAYNWKVTTRGDPDQDLTLHITEDDGTPADTLLGTSAMLPELGDEFTHHMRLAVVQSGTSVNWNIYLDGVSVLSGTRTSTTNHGVRQIQITTWGAGGSETAYGHVVLHTIPVGGGSLPSVTTAAGVALGRVGETAGRRIERLCVEEGVAFSSTGDLDESAGMGPQPVAGFLDLVHECEAADLGFLFEPRTALGLHYLTRSALYNQSAALTFDYASRVFADLTPVDDDQALRNDVTVSRTGGASYNATLATGALSTQAPPNGVGRYDETVTVNVAGDGNMLENQAGWRVHLGTVDEARYPTVHINLNSPGVLPFLAAGLIALDVGDRIDIVNLPSWLPPDDVSQLVQGFTETFDDGGYSRHITINCVPESPYRVAEYESAAGSSVNKYDTAGSQLNEDLTTTETGVDVLTTTGPAWTADDVEDGFQIIIGGEVMTVTNIGAAIANLQTFTVTRSVNGVVKAHSTGAAVRLWPRPVYAL